MYKNFAFKGATNSNCNV